MPWTARRGDLDAVAEAAGLLRAAVATVPTRHPDYPEVATRFAVALVALFQRTGDPALLGESIRMMRRAMAARPTDDAQARLGLFLEFPLIDLCTSTGQVDALHEAITLARQDRLCPHNSVRVEHARLLAEALTYLSQCTGEPEPTRQAATMLRPLAGDADADAILVANRLGDALLREYELTEDMSTLDEAVRAYRAAAERHDDGNLDYGLYQFDLGRALHLQADCGVPEALDGAVTALRAAHLSTAMDHVSYGIHATAYADALLARYRLDDTRSPLEEARACLHTAAGNTASPVQLRIEAYQKLAALPAHQGWSAADSLRAVESAVELLPLSGTS